MRYGYTIADRPLRLKPGENYISCSLYIVSHDPGTIINLLAHVEDEGAWYLGEICLDDAPRNQWCTLTARIASARKRNSPNGGDVYKPSLVRKCSLSIFGGSATMFVDDFVLTENRPPNAVHTRTRVD